MHFNMALTMTKLVIHKRKFKLKWDYSSKNEVFQVFASLWNENVNVVICENGQQVQNNLITRTPKSTFLQISKISLTRLGMVTKIDLCPRGSPHSHTWK